MPDTKGQSGVEHFEDRSKAVEEKSSDTARSTYSTTPGTGGDGPIVQQVRGVPGKRTKKSKK